MRVLVVGLCAVLLAACTATSDPRADPDATAEDPGTGTDQPAGDEPAAGDEEAPAPVSPRVSAPTEPTTVLPGGDAGELAVAASRALYDEAPVVLLAADDDLGAQARAASFAVRLGAPLLLVPAAATAGESGDGSTSGEPGADGRAEEAGAGDVPEELDRLGATTALTFGDGPTGWAGELEGDVAVVPAPTDPDELAAVTGTSPGAARTVAAGDVTGAVAALGRHGSLTLTVEDPEPDGDEADAETGDAEAEVEADDAEGDGTPEADAAATSGDGDGDLPRLRAAPPLDSLVVLASPDEAEAAATATARAAGARVIVLADPDPRADGDAIAALNERRPDRVLALGEGFGEPERLHGRLEVAATGVELPGGGQVLFPDRRFVALYGHPGTPALGVLGEQPLEDAVRRAEQVAADYEPLSDMAVVPAFEIIATIASASAGSDGNYSDVTQVEVLRPWVDAAAEAGIYVVLDLQPGRSDFLTQARAFEELLLEPHVGLALDPEWRLGPDQVHLRQIGSVSAGEVNEVVTWLADLTREHRLPQKLLIVHQFRLSMISDRDELDTSRDEVAVLLHADGHGTPSLKHETWDALTASPPPDAWWGWKNFYDEDSPTMSPAETVEVEPPPLFISYQ